MNTYFVVLCAGRKEDVEMAKKEIESAADHFSQIRACRKNNFNGSSAPGPPNMPGQTTIQVWVPYKVVGLVVGPKGATIKRIQQTTHTYIVTPSREKPPIFEVTGLLDNVESARKEIESHIVMRTGTVVDEELAAGLFCKQNNLSRADLISSPELTNIFRTQYMQSCIPSTPTAGYERDVVSLNNNEVPRPNSAFNDVPSFNSAFLGNTAGNNSANFLSSMQQNMNPSNIGSSTGLPPHVMKPASTQNGFTYRNFSDPPPAHSSEKELLALISQWDTKNYNTQAPSSFANLENFSDLPTTVNNTMGDLNRGISSVTSLANTLSGMNRDSFKNGFGFNSREATGANSFVSALGNYGAPNMSALGRSNLDGGYLGQNNSAFNVLGVQGTNLLNGARAYTDDKNSMLSIRVPEKNSDEGIDSMGSSNSNSKASSPSLENKINKSSPGAPVDTITLSARLNQVHDDKGLFNSRGHSPIDNYNHIWGCNLGQPNNGSAFKFDALSQAIDGVSPIARSEAERAMDQTAVSVVSNVLSGDDDSTTSTCSRRSSTDLDLESRKSACAPANIQMSISVSDN